MSVVSAVVAALVLLLNVQLSRSCDVEGRSLICHSIPSYFSPGCLTLLMYVNGVGNINSTAFHSESLASVTRLRMDGAGVTGVAEGAFTSLKNLTSVSLTGNFLTQVNSNWFGRPAVLSELSLSENQIEAVNESTLGGFVGLTKLSLKRNRIRTIGPNSFGSLGSLAELDLSENRMTWLSPQVLGSLRSTKIRLDGNPWDCSCVAQDFVFSVKGLQSRAQLEREAQVTCASPSALSGQPVWNVTVCTTSPEPGPTSVSQSSAAAEEVETTASHAKTESSVQSKPTDGALKTSLTATPSSRPASQTSANLRPSDLITTASTHTATHVTSAPSHSGASGNCATSNPALDSNTDRMIMSALVAVIVVLCVLLFAGCFLVIQHRGKHIDTAVMPGNPIGERVEQDSGTNPDQSPLGRSDNRDPELVLRRPFTGVRPKSAHAVLCTSAFTASGDNPVTEQTEAEQDKRADVDSQGVQVKHFTIITEKSERQTDGSTEMQENGHCVSVATDTVPYLSMSTNQSEAQSENVSTESTGSFGQRSQKATMIGRVSTWPLTAAQWPQKCKVKDEEFPGQEKETVNTAEPQEKKAGEDEKNQREDFVNSPNRDPAKIKSRHSQSSELQYKTASHCEVQAHVDVKQEELTAARGERREGCRKTPNRDVKPAENPTHKAKRERGGQRNEEGPENTSAGSKAPSGGASPDDGNEYAFMDLLHEVAQNRGRWTRERWRQAHANKQRR